MILVVTWPAVQWVTVGGQEVMVEVVALVMVIVLLLTVLEVTAVLELVEVEG